MLHAPGAAVDIRWPRGLILVVRLIACVLVVLALAIAGLVGADWTSLRAVSPAVMVVGLGALPLLVALGGVVAALRASRVAVTAEGDTLTIVSLVSRTTVARPDVDGFRTADSRLYVLLRGGSMQSLPVAVEPWARASARLQVQAARLESWLRAAPGQA